MITLTGHESFAVLRNGKPITVKLRDLSWLDVLALANLHRNDPDTRLFEALMARQYRLRRAHDRQRPEPACGGWDDDDGGRAA